jgi:hypothetical protein
MTRPGARSSSVENVLASRAGLRVQMSMTPLPTLIRSVVAAKAAIGTTASRTRRLSACQTASNPCCLGVADELDAFADGVGVLQVQRDGSAHAAERSRLTFCQAGGRVTGV